MKAMLFALRLNELFGGVHCYNARDFGDALLRRNLTTHINIIAATRCAAIPNPSDDILGSHDTDLYKNWNFVILIEIKLDLIEEKRFSPDKINLSGMEKSPAQSFDQGFVRVIQMAQRKVDCSVKVHCPDGQEAERAMTDDFIEFLYPRPADHVSGRSPASVCTLFPGIECPCRVNGKRFPFTAAGLREGVANLKVKLIFGRICLGVEIFNLRDAVSLLDDAASYICATVNDLRLGIDIKGNNTINFPDKTDITHFRVKGREAETFCVLDSYCARAGGLISAGADYCTLLHCEHGRVDRGEKINSLM